MIKYLSTLFALLILHAGCSIKEPPADNPTLSKPTIKVQPKAPAQPKGQILGQRSSTIKPVRQPTVQPTKPQPQVLVQPKPTQVQKPKPMATSGELLFLPTVDGSLIKANADGLELEFLDADHQGQNILLFLFGHDCPYCQSELPMIKQLANNPKIKVIGIHAKSMIGDDRLRAYIRRKGINFPVLSFKNDIKLIRFLKKTDYFDGSVPCNILVYPDGHMERVSENEVLQKI